MCCVQPAARSCSAGGISDRSSAGRCAGWGGGYRDAAQDDGVLWAHCDHTDIAGIALLTELVQVRRPDLTVCHVRSPARQDRYGRGGEHDW